MREQFIKDMEHMEEAMERTVNRTDIWQDRIVYWMAVTLFHILIWIVRGAPNVSSENEERKNTK